jgi:hypothetical protein
VQEKLGYDYQKIKVKPQSPATAPFDEVKI